MNKELSELDILSSLYYFPHDFFSFIFKFETSYFSEEYRSYFRFFKKFYKTYSTIISEEVIKTELDGSEKNEVLSILENIQNNSERISQFTTEYLLDKIILFGKRNYIKKSLIESYEDFENTDYDKIIERFSNFNDVMAQNDNGTEYHDEEFYKNRYNEGDEVGETIKSGFEQFDNEFEGWHRKSLNIIAGPANSGKTMYLVNMASIKLIENVEKNGCKILYVTLEIDEKQLARRIDASITKIPVKELYRDKNLRDKHVNELIEISRDASKNGLIIKEMVAYKTTPSDIDALIRNIMVTTKGEFVPDLVLIDYLGLMVPTNHNPRMNTYEKYLEAAVELRGLAQKYNIPFIVAAQTNRSSYRDEVDMDQISDSIGISQTCDLLITINRDEELDKNNMVQLYLAKSRFSKKGGKFLFSVDYDCQRVDDIVDVDVNKPDSCEIDNEDFWEGDRD